MPEEARDEEGPVDGGYDMAVRHCESGERALADLLERHPAGRGECPGDGAGHRADVARLAGLALLDNVRELRVSLSRLDAALAVDR